MQRHEDLGEDATKAPQSAKARLLAIVGNGLVLAGLGMAVACVLAVVAVVTHTPDAKGGARSVEAAVASPLVYEDLPEVVGNLKDTYGRPRYVKVAVVVELPEESVPALHEAETRILAGMQLYLRDLDPAELSGRAGAQQLRDEVLTMTNHEIAPAAARSVLFKTLLVN